MNPSFGASWSEWVLSVVGGVLMLIISGFINRLYKRIEALEAALPKRMEQYHQDQVAHRDRLDAQLQELRHTSNEHAVKLSAIRAKVDQLK